LSASAGTPDSPGDLLLASLVMVCWISPMVGASPSLSRISRWVM
jgi:hypothetical protein